MIHQIRFAITVLFAGVIAATLISCASEEAKSTEQMLAAAGFQVRFADTPEKLANLEKLTQRRLVVHPYGDSERWVYADAAGCKCVYAGDEKAYQQYEKEVVEQNIANQQEMTAEMNQDAAMDWGAWGWGGYGPW
jgi:hypothetical protein